MSSLRTRLSGIVRRERPLRRRPEIRPQPAEAESPPLSAAVNVYIAVIAAIALLSLALAWSVAPPLISARPILAVGFASAMAVGGIFPLVFVRRTQLGLDSTVLVAAVLLFPPAVAMVIAAAGALVAHIVRRRQWDETAFNVGQIAIVAAAGGGFLSLANWQVWELSLSQPGMILTALLAGIAMWVLNLLLIAPIVAFQTNEPLWYVINRSVRTMTPDQRLAHLSEILLGVLVAGVSVSHGRLVALLLLPAGALYQALAHHIRLRRHAEERLHHQAFHDFLTDLPNRALFQDRLEQALARADRRDERVAVLFIDIDRFKFVNDSLGHAAGDQLLVAVAKRFLECSRPGDTVARLGGDEFTILLEDVNGSIEAEQFAAAISATLEAPFDLTGHEVSITASIGIAVAASNATTATDLQRDADIALYRAKHEGKARMAVFDSAIDAGARQRVALEVDLRTAVANEELVLAYQPQVELESGRVVGVEALVRWNHPQLGTLPPQAFVPLAEETGLILDIGRWVLQSACVDGRFWQQRYTMAPVVSVNVSALQFRDANLVNDVGFALRRSGFNPGSLKLEITESAMMVDADQAAITLEKLKALGVRIAIDDFGTGYSSLDYLRRFPVDQIKVDRAFVSGLGRDTGDTAIVRAIVGLSHALGLTVVAEGVENAPQVARLRGLGCEMAQGFFFGRPLPLSAVTDIVANLESGVEESGADRESPPSIAPRDSRALPLRAIEA